MNATITNMVPSTSVGLLEDFVELADQLGGQPAYRRERQAAASAFLTRNPSLQEWMSRPVDARLVELDRHMVWPFLAYCLLYTSREGARCTSRRPHGTGPESATRFGWSKTTSTRSELCQGVLTESVFLNWEMAGFEHRHSPIQEGLSAHLQPHPPLQYRWIQVQAVKCCAAR